MARRLERFFVYIKENQESNFGGSYDPLQNRNRIFAW